MSTEIVRAIDNNGDWLFGKGQNDYVAGNAAVAQDIQTGLLSFFGDCFFDTSAGIDWYGLMTSKNFIALNLAIQAVIIDTEGVSALLELSFVVDDNRNATIKYQVVTIYSQNQALFGSVAVAIPGSMT